LTNIERAIDAVLRHGVFYYTDKNFSKVSKRRRRRRSEEEEEEEEEEED